MPYVTEQARAEAEGRNRERYTAGQLQYADNRVRASLRGALAAELDREARLYPWSTYGGVITLAGNAVGDIAFRTDPGAYFVCSELQYSILAGGALLPQELRVQAIQDGDRQLLRNALLLTAFAEQGLPQAGVYHLPREWIFRPGSAGTIRLATIAANPGTIRFHLGGHRVQV